jgi:deoxyribonuclease V
VTLALLDVCYRGIGARAACVLAESWAAQTPSSTCVQAIEKVEPYEPGSFYRRELPCLLAVLRLLPEPPAVVVVDGYVWLPPSGRPGLGARLYEALGGGTAVIGIAKSAFAGAESCAFVVPVLRGTSKRPLYVTAAGIEVGAAAQRVRGMAGKYRIPDLARMADRLASSSSAVKCVSN